MIKLIVRRHVAMGAENNTVRDLKILILINGLWGSGAERVTLNLATDWRDAGAKVTIATLLSEEHDACPIPSGICRVSLNIPYQRFSLLSILRNNVRPLVAIRRLLRQERPDIAIAMITLSAIGLALARTGEEAAIGEEHGHPPTVPSSWIFSLMRRLSYGRLDAVVALTPQSATWLRENTHARKVVVIPNSIRLPLPDHEPKITPGTIVPTEKKLLLAVGRLHEKKRFDLLLDAFAHIKDRHSDWHLVILGEGDSREELEAQVDRLGLSEQVHLPGFTGSVAEWYRSADALASTSETEGFGMILIEAMALGCPVISIDCPMGPRNIIRNGETGLLVPMDDFDALVDGLDRMLSDDALRKRLASNAVEVLDTYSPDRINARWQYLFDELKQKQNAQTKRMQ